MSIRLKIKGMELLDDMHVCDEKRSWSDSQRVVMLITKLDGG
jgi:hypothetical protein